MRISSVSPYLLAALLAGALLLYPRAAQADTFTTTLDSNPIGVLSALNTSTSSFSVQFTAADVAALHEITNIQISESLGQPGPDKLVVDITNTTTDISLVYTFNNDTLTSFTNFLSTSGERIYEADFLYSTFTLQTIPNGGGGGTGVPEPSTLFTLFAGASGILALRRFRPA